MEINYFQLIIPKLFWNPQNRNTTANHLNHFSLEEAPKMVRAPGDLYLISDDNFTFRFFEMECLYC